MKQNDLNRAIARATGETVSTIASLGFLLDEPGGRFDSHLNDPDIIDWDVMDERRHSQDSQIPRGKLAVT